MAGSEVLVGVAISHRTRQIQVNTTRRGEDSQVAYDSLQQAPEALRSDALKLILDAVRNAGYASLAQLDHALTVPLVMPDEEIIIPDEPDIFAGESISIYDDEVRIGGG